MGILVCAMLLLLCPSNLAAEATKPVSAPVINFERFRKVDDPWKILDDPQIKKEITHLMGNKAEDFWNCSQSSSLAEKGQDVFVNSMVNGLAEDLLSFVDLNFAKKKLFAGYLISGKFHVFGAKNESELPTVAKEFIASQTHDLKDPQVIYDHADWKTKPIAKAAPKKKLNLTSMTGTYERPESRFTAGILKVLALPGSKIKFSVVANSGGRSGEADGEVPIVNNRAELKSTTFAQSTSKIILKFEKGAFNISGQDFDFCGAGVTLTGDYDKVDDKPPVFD
jgi:hypothetical protein